MHAGPLLSPGVGMRILAICLCALGTLLARPSAAQAEQACPAGALGISRVAEVDTTGGPWFGEPHGNRDFLAPGEVVLTFDDGPAPRSTRAILAALAAQCTRATFFVVGERVVEFPDVVGEIAAQGHTIGTHTWSHKNLKRLSEEQSKAQIEATFAAAEKAARQPIAPFFRYPYLSDSTSTVAYLQSRNIGQFAIDIDSFDWRTRNAKAVIHRVMAALERRGRGIILFHDIHTSTAQAVPELLVLLKAKGFKVVHMRAKSAAETLAGYQPPVMEAKIRVARRHSIVRMKAGNRVSGWPGW
jgi:peptidoglycan/xylan/chitin deacetylase (PgdA/CDA1 family)